MTKLKKYIISENQYNKLIEIKKKEKILAEKLIKDINKRKKYINESAIMNEAIVDVLKKYFRKGLLTTAVISSLLSNNVDAKDLISAGVSQNEIDNASKNIVKPATNNIDKIENQLIRSLKKRGQQGTLQQYESLNQEEKNNVLKSIQQSGKNIDDIDISIYLNRTKELNGDRYTKIGEKKEIEVDTIYVDSVIDYSADFEFNSAKIKDINKLRNDFQNIINNFYRIDKITIVSSSSTLRNKGDFLGLTWEEGSQLRVNAMKEVILGIQYNLGGCGLNPVNQISENMIDQNIKGSNGDGTSGPKSPMEIDQEGIDWYNQNNIPENLWKSDADENPYGTIEDVRNNPNILNEYKKFQYVKLLIKGEIVETQTNEIVNYNYLKIEKRDKIKIEKVKEGKKNVKVNSCPIH